MQEKVVIQSFSSLHTETAAIYEKLNLIVEEGLKGKFWKMNLQQATCLQINPLTSIILSSITNIHKNNRQNAYCKIVSL